MENISANETDPQIIKTDVVDSLVPQHIEQGRLVNKILLHTIEFAICSKAVRGIHGMC